MVKFIREYTADPFTAILGACDSFVPLTRFSLGKVLRVFLFVAHHFHQHSRYAQTYHRRKEMDVDLSFGGTHGDLPGVAGHCI